MRPHAITFAGYNLDEKKIVDPNASIPAQKVGDPCTKSTIYRSIFNHTPTDHCNQLANLIWEYTITAPILNQGERLLVIRIIQGYSIEEIARILAVHPRTLYAAINRIESKRIAHEKLRKQNPEPLRFGDYVYKEKTYYSPKRHRCPQTLLLKTVSFLEQENLVKRETI